MKAAPDLADSPSTDFPAEPDLADPTLAEPAYRRRPTPGIQHGQRMSDGPTLDELLTYYGCKTAAILRRYGPGPRVHYHTGIVDELEPLDVPPDVLRRRLVAAQERIVKHAAEVWRAGSHLSGDLLDVGCGLGGGALYWAQEFGATVTAITLVAEHAKLVENFAALVGLASRVKPLVCDALALQGHNSFDAAVAFDASCHLPRREWFRRLYALLRPGGRVFISDCFLGRPENAEPFDRYWHTRIGTITEYVAAAREAGMRLDMVEDLSRRTRHFFSITLALIQAETLEAGGNAAELARLEASRHAHTLLRDCLGDKGFEYALLSFVKERSAGAT